MGMAATVENYLKMHRIPHETVDHAPTACATETAEEAHVSSRRLAKAVLMKRPDGHFLAILPASHRVMAEDLEFMMGGPVQLAAEDEIGRYFHDCVAGAVPALGWPYGLDMVVDDRLDDEPDVYFEGGDHRTLVHVDHDTFRALTETASRGRFSQHG